MKVTCKDILAKGKASVRGILSVLVQTKGELDGKDIATPMKNEHITQAFTTLELIFVIILISVLASVGIGFIPNHDVQNDTNFVFMKIKEKQKNAINYDTNTFSNTPWKKLTLNSKEYNLTCIKLDKITLNSIEESSNEQKKYTINTNLTTNLMNNTLCFDFLGRPYDYDMEQLLLDKVVINMSYKNISVYPMSGYAKIH